MEGTLFLQTTLVPGKEAKIAKGLPRAGREGEWGALIGRAPGEIVGLAALLLGDFGARPSEKARFFPPPPDGGDALFINGKKNATRSLRDRRQRER